jgi:hypothetical protein
MDIRESILLKFDCLCSPQGFHFSLDEKRNKKSSQINGYTLCRSRRPLEFDTAPLPLRFILNIT